MASPTQWTWVWASSRRWWRTDKPGVLHSWGGKEWNTAEGMNNNHKNNNGLKWKPLSRVWLSVTPWTITVIYYFSQFLQLKNSESTPRSDSGWRSLVRLQSSEPLTRAARHIQGSSLSFLTSNWRLLAEASVPLHMDISTGLLECPHDIPPDQMIEDSKTKAEMPLLPGFGTHTPSLLCSIGHTRPALIQHEKVHTRTWIIGS